MFFESSSLAWFYEETFRWGHEGKILGRPSALSTDQQVVVKEKIKNGEAISAIARHFETSRQTIMRVRDQA